MAVYFGGQGLCAVAVAGAVGRAAGHRCHRDGAVPGFRADRVRGTSRHVASAMVKGRRLPSAQGWPGSACAPCSRAGRWPVHGQRSALLAMGARFAPRRLLLNGAPAGGPRVGLSPRHPSGQWRAWSHAARTHRKKRQRGERQRMCSASPGSATAPATTPLAKSRPTTACRDDAMPRRCGDQYQRRDHRRHQRPAEGEGGDRPDGPPGLKPARWR